MPHFDTPNSTHYETLEVSPRASAAVIQAAYRCLAQHHHPDRHRGSDPGGNAFKNISLAYTVLRDPGRKEAYDRSMGLLTLSSDRRSRHNTHTGYAASLSSGPDRSRPFGFRPLV